ncbi:PAS domain-containing protein [Oceanibaculum indicum]|uniref:PAS domain-containing protein n=1 Tax=Oceanibaculum indicum TaxID=526216 RepID=A0A420WNI8_9PROT|nr:PAS domain-containing protein [Oceanibaculum indicum]RKQ72589.1 PAS domain-containing protein [Oceanibaculum indicum]
MVKDGRSSKDRDTATSNPSIASFSRKLTHPHHRQMFDYWHGRFIGTLPPSRSAIDPVDIPTAVLPWLVLYNVHWVPDEQGSERPRFEFRLVGTGVVQRYNRDSTGKYFEDVYDNATFPRMMAAFSEVALNCRPAYAQLQMPIPGRDFIPYERLLLPLAGEDGRVEAIIAVMGFKPN